MWTFYRLSSLRPWVCNRMLFCCFSHASLDSLCVFLTCPLPLCIHGNSCPMMSTTSKWTMLSNAVQMIIVMAISVCVSVYIPMRAGSNLVSLFVLWWVSSSDVYTCRELYENYFPYFEMTVWIIIFRYLWTMLILHSWKDCGEINFSWC